MPVAEENQRRTVAIDEAAKILGITRNHAYRAAQSGDLPTIRLGKRLFVPVAALRRMLGEDVVAP